MDIRCPPNILEFFSSVNMTFRWVKNLLNEFFIITHVSSLSKLHTIYSLVKVGNWLRKIMNLKLAFAYKKCLMQNALFFVGIQSNMMGGIMTIHLARNSNMGSFWEHLVQGKLTPPKFACKLSISNKCIPVRNDIIKINRRLIATHHSNTILAQKLKTWFICVEWSPRWAGHSQNKRPRIRFSGTPHFGKGPCIRT